jgi:hypothetical protein
MAEFPNRMFTQTVGRSHQDKRIPHKKKTHKVHHETSQSWNVSSSSLSSAVSRQSESSCTSEDSEQNIRSKLKKIKREGMFINKSGRERNKMLFK